MSSFARQDSEIDRGLALSLTESLNISVPQYTDSQGISSLPQYVPHYVDSAYSRDVHSCTQESPPCTLAPKGEGKQSDIPKRWGKFGIRMKVQTHRSLDSEEAGQFLNMQNPTWGQTTRVVMSE